MLQAGCSKWSVAFIGHFQHNCLGILSNTRYSSVFKDKFIHFFEKPNYMATARVYPSNNAERPKSGINWSHELYTCFASECTKRAKGRRTL